MAFHLRAALSASGLFLVAVALYSSFAASERRDPPRGQPVKPVRSESVKPCMGVVPCATAGYRVRVIDLIRNANRYDRRVVVVNGEVVMLRDRRSPCGDYLYFVLKDAEGHFVNVTDYTRSTVFLEERKVTVRGYYRAHMHEIQVCSEVLP